jgi:hypothetical protein
MITKGAYWAKPKFAALVKVLVADCFLKLYPRKSGGIM